MEVEQTDYDGVIKDIKAEAKQPGQLGQDLRAFDANQRKSGRSRHEQNALNWAFIEGYKRGGEAMALFFQEACKENTGTKRGFLGRVKDFFFDAWARLGR